MKFKPDEIVSVLTRELSGLGSGQDVREVGTVLEVGDGIARVYGLSAVMAGEMVEFTRTKIRALAFNLEESSVAVIILGDYLQIQEGDEVRTTGELLRVPVGDALIGRVVDPLGNPLDGKGPIITTETRPMESPAAGVAERQPVKVPLQTGIKAIDAMTPIGRGQRELIIGDRKTGKTAIALDTIINQKSENVICVYVACGQMQAKISQVVEDLRRTGAMDYTIVVASSSADPAPLQYYAPYAGTAMAEYFMNKGRDTLVVYDDLSKQAAAYRQLSLLVRRPPGREAYPGDVFYAHSRLLERSAKLADRWVIVPNDADDKSVTDDWAVNSAADPTRKRNSGEAGKVYVGPSELTGKAYAEHHDLARFPGHKLARVATSGGSLTALPIIETLEGEVSAYIPTNVISITDGQIYLQPSLFFAGVRPAVDVGISVSRVGGNAQIGAMKDKRVAGGLKLTLAQFRELEAFAQLGTELDPATQRQLDRGYRMVEILKQAQFKPMNVVDQVMVIYAANAGALDKVDRRAVRKWEEQFLTFMQDQMPEVRALLAKEKKLTDEVTKQLDTAIAAFQPQFNVGDAKPVGVGGPKPAHGPASADQYTTRRMFDTSVNIRAKMMGDERTLKPQAWLVCRDTSSAAIILRHRPSAIEQYLSGDPELVQFSDGEAAAVFHVKTGSGVLPVLQGVLSTTYGTERPVVTGGVAVAVPSEAEQRKISTLFGGAEAIVVGNYMGW